ncbi:MAG: hypothetical protein HY664_03410 [Chloroflexi bacterium]|nr:hypothetical protein [Chloroflexota bacterium]
MGSNTALQYFLFVFVSACGVLQVAAARGRLRGLLLWDEYRWSYVLGLFAVSASFWWFFNVEDWRVAGLEGGPQLVLFAAAAICAIVFTIFFSSLIKALLRSLAKDDPPANIARSRGLGALEEMTYIQAWLLRIRRKTGILSPKETIKRLRRILGETR